MVDENLRKINADRASKDCGAAAAALQCREKNTQKNGGKVTYQSKNHCSLRGGQNKANSKVAASQAAQAQGQAEAQNHSTDKENACQNQNKDNKSAIISTDAKSGVRKPLKPSTNFGHFANQNSNKINIRKAYGSNDSIANAAPLKKKYTLKNQFMQIKSKASQNSQNSKPAVAPRNSNIPVRN